MPTIVLLLKHLDAFVQMMHPLLQEIDGIQIILEPDKGTSFAKSLQQAKCERQVLHSDFSYSFHGYRERTEPKLKRLPSVLVAESLTMFAKLSKQLRPEKEPQYLKHVRGFYNGLHSIWNGIAEKDLVNNELHCWLLGSLRTLNDLC